MAQPARKREAAAGTVRPGPRSKPQILAATIAMLEAGGYAEVTIEGVAARAGVAKTTIYRWWATKAELVGEAVSRRMDPGVHPDTGNLRDDLVAAFEITRRNFSGTFAGEVLPVLAAGQLRDPELIETFRVKFLRSRRALVKDLFDRAIVRGEIPADVDQALIQDMLAGAIVYRTLMSGEPFTDDIVQRMVDAVLRGRVPRQNARARRPRKRAPRG